MTKGLRDDKTEKVHHMPIFKIMLLASVSVMLAGCYHKHPGHPHDGNFCPPGQAKKGNC